MKQFLSPALTHAISTVIGAILMVLIAVTVVTAFYVYLQDLAEQNTKESSIQLHLVKDETNNTLLIQHIPSSTINWNELSFTHDNTITMISLTTGNETFYHQNHSWYHTINDTQPCSLNSYLITNNDYLTIHGSGTVSLIHAPSNKDLGTYSFN